MGHPFPSSRKRKRLLTRHSGNILLYLHYGHEFSLGEIASVLAIPPEIAGEALQYALMAAYAKLFRDNTVALEHLPHHFNLKNSSDQQRPQHPCPTLMQPSQHQRKDSLSQKGSIKDPSILTYPPSQKGAWGS
jgi:hypothetical protein